MSEWTTEVPTEPGWYWYKKTNIAPLRIYSRTVIDAEVLRIRIALTEYGLGDLDGEWWPDPITEPPND